MKVVMTADSVHSPLTGIGQYTWQLASALTELSPAPEIAFLRQNGIERQLPTLFEMTKEVPQASSLRASKTIKLNLPGIDYLADRAAQKKQQQALRHEGPDLFHGTNFTLVASDAASVVTIYDLSVLKYPDYHPPVRVRRIRRKLREAAQRAHIVITVSQSVRDELVSGLGIPQDRCHVTHLAAGTVFRPQNSEALSAKLAALNLVANGYCFFCSTIEPRKNLVGLIQAYRQMPLSMRVHYPLVLVGSSGWKNRSEMSHIREAADEGWLRYLGFVDTETQAALYAGCRLFVLPSHYEGFGLPLLEAMASGAPTICSTAGALVEVAGDAATTFYATDIGKLAELIRTGLEDDKWRTESSQLGLRRAQDFSWHKCAQETMKAYRHAMDMKS